MFAPARIIGLRKADDEQSLAVMYVDMAVVPPCITPATLPPFLAVRPCHHAGEEGEGSSWGSGGGAEMRSEQKGHLRGGERGGRGGWEFLFVSCLAPVFWIF